MTKSVTLYTYALSPYGMKVYWALVYKQIPFSLQYVSPSDQREIAFTNQQMVPVVKVGDQWRLDSGPICQWLDEEFPARPFAGNNAQEQQAIIDADGWVARHVIGLSFRAMIDDDKPFSAFRNGRKLAKLMRATSGGVPWWAQFVWVNGLRRASFINKDASHVGRDIPVAQSRQNTIEGIKQRIAKTGFIAGTNQPSYADAAIFAQLASSSTFRFEGDLSVHSAPSIKAYYQALRPYFELTNVPALAPNWQPFGFGR